MSAATRVLAWLDRRSDDVSPLVVKEARQVVRSREFLFSFLASLVAGLAVAFGGATDALSGETTSGRWTFVVLMGCLSVLGLVVVPIAAFSTLRQERMEQTLELITLTSLSARRVVVGKLLAQSVKLLTLFAAIAPFLTMSFLLGGIDLTTILISLAMLYMASVWAGALCLFLSTLFKSRAASGLVFGLMGLMVIMLLPIGLSMFRLAVIGVPMPTVFGSSFGSAEMFKELTLLMTFWATTLVNFVLLAGHRLSLATEDSVRPLRIGFFAQFLLTVWWALVSLISIYRMATVESMTALGAIHLAIVALFVVTEEISVSRRVLHRMRIESGVRRLLALFGPGAGRGAAYVVAQMVALLAVMAMCQTMTAGLHPPAVGLRRILAACGYICFFTGLPVLAFWRFAPARVSPFKLRVAVLCAIAAALVLPDVIHYLIVRPEVLDVSYGARHLINPFRTLSQWPLVEARGWTMIPFVMGLIGLLAYVQLFILGARSTSHAMLVDPQAVPVEEATIRGSILH